MQGVRVVAVIAERRSRPSTLGFRLRARLSICSALCYQQERTLEEAVDKVTKDSEEYRAVKAIFGELHDSYFGYRYLAKMRNVLIRNDDGDQSGDEGQRQFGKPIAVIQLNMHRTTLIESDKLNAS